MDYRERKYYLVTFYNYNQSIDILKTEIPSLKIHNPYNHFRNNKAKSIIKMKSKTIDYPSVYDGDITNLYVQVMLSCRFEDSEILEKIIKEEMSSEFIKRYTYFQEITKEECKQ